jgi:hypothetical protein
MVVIFHNKTNFMRALILLSFLSLSGMGLAQRTGIYSVTDTKAGGASWLNIREVSPDNGEGRLVLQNNAFTGTRVDVATQQKRSVSMESLQTPGDLPLQGGVAALAYDRAHNRLYYSTMFSGDIRYVQPGKNENTYYQVGEVYRTIPLPNNVPLSATNQGPVITRMTMGADGYVYGLSNNGDAFFRFSTRNASPVIESLGSLVDDPANGDMSIHSSCSSWGGDMVGCANGDIYVFSMYQQVFKVNPSTRVATYLGKIQGLPGDFTVNGAAVDEQGAVLLSSAAVAGKIAIIEDPTNLTAKVKTQSNWLNASDLASGHLLFSQKHQAEFGEFDRSVSNSGIGVFPNPATNGTVIVHFKEGMKGRYALDLLDVGGSPKVQSVLTLNGEPQRFNLRTGNIASGIYLLRVTNPQQREVETIKVLIR